MSINNYIGVGNLTRDVEVKEFASGGKVAKFGIAISERKKNSQTGQWEDAPVFADVEVYNRGEFGKLADFAADRLKKGSRITLQAKLGFDQWDDKATGQKRSKLKLVAEDIQLHDRGQGGAEGEAPKAAGKGKGGGRRAAPEPDVAAGEDDAEIPF